MRGLVDSRKTAKLGHSEGVIEEGICQYLSLFRNGKVFKIAPSGFYNGTRFVKHKSKFIINGHSDLVYLQDGRSFYFEVKTPQEYKYLMKHYAKIKTMPKKTLNKKQAHLRDQIDFIEDVRCCGHTGEFVYSIEMVKEIIDKVFKRK